jgi:hypothetical protein
MTNSNTQHQESRAGRFVTHLKGYKAFQPTLLPPEPPLTLDEELTYLLGQATHAVGKLSGLSAIIPDPDLFVYLYVRKEALLSSQIEGTQCRKISGKKSPESQLTRRLVVVLSDTSSVFNQFNRGNATLSQFLVSPDQRFGRRDRAENSREALSPHSR